MPLASSRTEPRFEGVPSPDQTFLGGRPVALRLALEEERQQRGGNEPLRWILAGAAGLLLAQTAVGLAFVALLWVVSA